MHALLVSQLLVSGVLGAALGRNVARQSETAALWQPAPASKIQMVISGAISVDGAPVPSDVGIFDIDMFENSASTVQALHNSGVKVICYFSAGTSEDWRPDYNDFTSADKGAGLPDWQGEAYLDLRSENVLNIMKKRIANAASLGCDGIDPDNMGESLYSSNLSKSQQQLY
jgi:hypothetical protein